MIPHERSLVAKWKDKPFVIVGVNSDDTSTDAGRTKFRAQVKEFGVEWRSFRDDSVTPKISETWRVEGWPTVYFIDHAGIIRHKDVLDEAEMERVLGEMIAAAEQAAANKK